MVGKIFIYLAFIFSLVSLFGFYRTHLGNEKYLKIGRLFYHFTAVMIIAASFFLLYNIVTHQFQYTYIWANSNTDLQLPLLMSTFFAGQEGSFLLWSLMTAVIGIFLLNFVSKGNRLEPQVMVVYTLVLGFLALILILKSPFEYVWESFHGEVETGFMPENGRGLNPLLQNFWMIIHPPVLFLGYASLAVPFSFSIAALMKNSYEKWIGFSLPWILFSGAALGLGIILGGYWAYGVLGWGGYWGWDPVENSSLVPWIITIAVIHTMVAQKRTGGYKKTNLILVILSFLLVLYSTFLTRSGILGDSSVHSFTDPGSEVYLALVLFIGSFVLISIIAIAFRLKDLKNLNTSSGNLFSRESGLYIGVIALCASALIIIAGTSLPIVSEGSIEPEFYNRMNLPLAILISFLIGISIFLEWKSADRMRLLKKLVLPIILAIVATLILIIIGLNDILMILFALAALFTFFVNLQLLIKIVQNKKFTIGAYLSHIGIAMLFLGVIGSAFYSEEENLSLELDKPKEAFGYSLTYIGAEEFTDPDNKIDTKFHFIVRVKKGNDEFELKPVMYFSEISQGVMKNPDIANLITKDLYISPMSVEEPKVFSNEDTHIFKKGEQKEIKGLKIKFIDFEMEGMHMGQDASHSNDFTIGVNLEINDGGKVMSVTPKIKYKGDDEEYIPAEVNGKYLIYFSKMEVKNQEDGESRISLTVKDANDPKQQTKEETLLITASIKPFINVLWIGTAILVIGFIFSLVRRGRELKSKTKVNENQE